MAQRHMDRLTSFDTSFLANEKSNGHMAIGAVLMCDGEPPSHEDFVATSAVASTSCRACASGSPFRPCAWARPSGSTIPSSTSPTTSAARASPPPGDDAQFHDLVGEILSPPLDRSRPLWELVLVEGFEDDRFAIVYKTHHAMADGFSAVDIGALLFDVEPNPEPLAGRSPGARSRRPPTSTSPAGPSPASGRPRGAWRAGSAGAIRRPRRAGKRAADGIAGLWEVTWNLTKPAPKVPLNVEIGPARSFSWASFTLDDFKLIKNALGGDRQRRHPRGHGRRPAPLDARP